MASRQGQILYLGTSNSSSGSPGGSLSTRFQKLAQSRNSGITVVNQNSGIESRQGRSLGLGFGTGSQPSGDSGHHIRTGGRGSGGSVAGGIQTAGGLARAMQERGGGVTNEFLIAASNPRLLQQSGGGRRGGRGAGLVAVGQRGSGRGQQQQQQPSHNDNTRANRHKALALGGRPNAGQRQGGNHQAAAAPQVNARQGGGRAGRGGRGGAAVASGSVASKGGKGSKGEKSAKVKKVPVGADTLDSELSEYMMKNEQTAASLLDTDLDSYMADKPDDNLW